MRKIIVIIGILILVAGVWFDIGAFYVTFLENNPGKPPVSWETWIVQITITGIGVTLIVMGLRPLSKASLEKATE